MTNELATVLFREVLYGVLVSQVVDVAVAAIAPQQTCVTNVPSNLTGKLVQTETDAARCASCVLLSLIHI